MADVMKFLVQIDLGNEEMQTGVDIAERLRYVADEVEDQLGGHPVEEPLLMDTVITMRIYDANGNDVGKWAVKSLSAEQAKQQVGW